MLLEQTGDDRPTDKTPTETKLEMGTQKTEWVVLIAVEESTRSEQDRTVQG